MLVGLNVTCHLDKPPCRACQYDDMLRAALESITAHARALGQGALLARAQSAQDDIWDEGGEA